MSSLSSKFIFQLLRIIETFSFLCWQDLKIRLMRIIHFWGNLLYGAGFLVFRAMVFDFRFVVTFEVLVFDFFGCSTSDESIVKSIVGMDELGCCSRLGCRGCRIPLFLIFGAIAISLNAEWSGCTRFWTRFLSLFLL